MRTTIYQAGGYTAGGLPAPPVIDLACAYQVIDDTGDVPRWKTVGRGVHSQERARAAAVAAGYPANAAWIFDGIDREKC